MPEATSTANQRSSPQPQQPMTFVVANNNPQQQPQPQPQPDQPFLWVNPPMVAPSVPAPQPGNNTGSWCKSTLILTSIIFQSPKCQS